jgi:SAM-dependent methyltransferase
VTGPSARQSWQAGRYATHARFVADLGAPVLDLLAPRAGERILDLGCGDGALTEKLAALGCSIVGVDAAPDMIAAARARGLDARVMDGESLGFEDEFDAVFSNAALHWMRRPADVIAGVRRALRPGGRFVGEFGGHTNVAAIIVALTAVLDRRGADGTAAIPWYFPTPKGLSSRARVAGLRRREHRPHPAADAPADRHGGLARDLRRGHLRPPPSAGAAGGARRDDRPLAPVPLRYGRPLDRGLRAPALRRPPARLVSAR